MWNTPVSYMVQSHTLASFYFFEWAVSDIAMCTYITSPTRNEQTNKKPPNIPTYINEDDHDKFQFGANC